MKQFLTAFLSIFFFCANAQQQVGIKTGFNLATLEPMNEKATPYKRIINPGFGVAFNFALAENMYLQAEINYVSQGGKRTGIQKLTMAEKNKYNLPSAIDLYANLHNRITLNYLDVPVLIKFTYGSKIKYYMTVGPYISYLLSGKSVSNGESPVYTDDKGFSILKQDGISPTSISQQKTSADIQHDIKKIDFGVQAGWGLEYKTKPGSFFVESRLSLGAINIQAYPQTNGKTQTIGLLFSGGYMTNLK